MSDEPTVISTVVIVSHARSWLANFVPYPKNFSEIGRLPTLAVLGSFSCCSNLGRGIEDGTCHLSLKNISYKTKLKEWN